MTQYGITITFDDAEMKTLQTAVDHYLEKCRREVKRGASVPFYAHRSTLARFLASRKKALKRTPSLSLGENERIALEAALASYLERCNSEIANGVTVPFTADRAIVEKICARLLDEFWRAVFYVEAKRAASRGPGQ